MTMNDVILALIAPALVVVGVAFLKSIEHFWPECRHDYGDWDGSETEFAFIQQRKCKKCQFVYTYQERKINS